jgi:hypothetical protein
VIRGKKKEFYEAVILSKALDTTVEPEELLGRFRGLRFRPDKELHTFSLDFSQIPPAILRDWSISGRDERLKDATHIKIGIPGWLEDFLMPKSGL